MCLSCSYKILKNGKLKSFECRRKMNNAICFCGQCSGEQLSIEYEIGMKKYLNSYKKEYAKAKQQRDVDENAADAIPFSLYRLFLG